MEKCVCVYVSVCVIFLFAFVQPFTEKTLSSSANRLNFSKLLSGAIFNFKELSHYSYVLVLACLVRVAYFDICVCVC